MAPERLRSSVCLPALAWEWLRCTPGHMQKAPPRWPRSCPGPAPCASWPSGGQIYSYIYIYKIIYIYMYIRMDYMAGMQPLKSKRIYDAEVKGSPFQDKVGPCNSLDSRQGFAATIRGSLSWPSSRFSVWHGINAANALRSRSNGLTKSPTKTKHNKTHSKAYESEPSERERSPAFATPGSSADCPLAANWAMTRKVCSIMPGPRFRLPYLPKLASLIVTENQIMNGSHWVQGNSPRHIGRHIGRDSRAICHEGCEGVDGLERCLELLCTAQRTQYAFNHR